VEPFVSFGPLVFGASRDAVQAALGEKPREFRKGCSPTRVEAYKVSGAHAHYDEAGELEFVEVMAPCIPVYAGVQLLRPDATSVIAELEAAGLHVRDDRDGGYWFDGHGFALYAPYGETQGVSAFRRGYDIGAGESYESGLPQ
jgi:hypothetical protein